MTPYIITAGEPAGIGPDCIIRAWRLQPQAFENCIIAAPSCWITARAEQIGADIVIEEFSTLAAAENAVSISKTNRLVCWNPLPPGAALCQVNPGSPSGSTARAVIDCIAAAANACLQGDASGLITGPIEKAALRSTGFNFPGHTEFLAHLASEYGNCQHDFVMMLASDELRVALLTTHMALRDVPDAISIVETVKSLRIVEQDLRNRFGIRNPKLALCALNPH
ncbi:MAG: PdxA family protein, partial [Mariprofundus sp.]